MRLILLALGLVAAGTSWPIFGQEHAPNAPFFQIKHLSYGGTGCPEGSLSAHPKSNGDELKMNLSNWYAEIGSGLGLVHARKSCQVLLDLEYPTGWTYAVSGFVYSGYADLDSGVVGSLKVANRFQGEPWNQVSSGAIRGPFVNNFLLTNKGLFSDELRWAPCSTNRRALIVNHELRLTNSSGTANARGIMTVDAIDGDPWVALRLEWKRCL